VPAPNLTREQAKQRAALLDVDSYDIELDLTDGSGAPGVETFDSRTTVRFSCREPGADAWIDLVAARLRSATLNGTELDISGYDEEQGIVLPALAAHNELTVHADCQYMNTGEGLHRFVDPVDGNVYLYSQFESADAKRLFACFDQPDLKAAVAMTVTAPAEWNVVCNTLLQSATRSDNGALRRVFERSAAMSTYLVAIVAGPYQEWRDEHTSPVPSDY